MDVALIQCSRNSGKLILTRGYNLDNITCVGHYTCNYDNYKPVCIDYNARVFGSSSRIILTFLVKNIEIIFKNKADYSITEQLTTTFTSL